MELFCPSPKFGMLEITYVFTCVRVCVCWFVSKITQKIPNRISQNSNGGLVLDKE